MDTPTGTKTPQEVSIGQFVNYVLDQGPNAGSIRPAIVVNKFDKTTGQLSDNSPPLINLQVFIDGMNDGLDTNTGGLSGRLPGTTARTKSRDLALHDSGDRCQYRPGHPGAGSGDQRLRPGKNP
jgi:hypothetical protein